MPHPLHTKGRDEQKRPTPTHATRPPRRTRSGQASHIDPHNRSWQGGVDVENQIRFGWSRASAVQKKIAFELPLCRRPGAQEFRRSAAFIFPISRSASRQIPRSHPNLVANPSCQQTLQQSRGVLRVPSVWKARYRRTFHPDTRQLRLDRTRC